MKQTKSNNEQTNLSHSPKDFGLLQCSCVMGVVPFKVLESSLCCPQISRLVLLIGITEAIVWSMAENQ
uniref:Uncharacterized protein n=1 Tax=Anguilla anguilla TaxID=7936 RepID=A0A0E9VPS4_ANGAN